MTKQAFVLLSLIIMLTGCAGGSKLSRSAASYNDYEENLDRTRVTFPEIPQSPVVMPGENSGPISAEAGSPVDGDLQQALANFAKENEERGAYNGFTILVYSGINREQAFETRNKLYNSLPSQIKAEMEYEQPRYLVKVGRYIHRIEAQDLFHTIKQDFPSARIIRQRFGEVPQEEEIEEGDDI